MDQPSQNFFASIPSKTSFWLGFVTSILVLGTLGFFILGTCLLSNSCSIASTGTKQAKAENTAQPSQVATAPTAAAEVPVVKDTDHIRGKKDAKITIIEYSDYQCPFCSRFHPTMIQALEKYPNDLRWVFRHFPLSFHAEAEPAAEAAECASEQGKFWEYSDALFENQASLATSYYPELAKTLGLNVDKFNTCLSSDRGLTIVRKDAQDGASAGVSGTPGSFLIDKDGRAQEIKGAQPLATITAAIDALLAK